MARSEPEQTGEEIWLDKSQINTRIHTWRRLEPFQSKHKVTETSPNKTKMKQETKRSRGQVDWTLTFLQRFTACFHPKYSCWHVKLMSLVPSVSDRLIFSVIGSTGLHQIHNSTSQSLPGRLLSGRWLCGALWVRTGGHCSAVSGEEELKSVTADASVKPDETHWEKWGKKSCKPSASEVQRRGSRIVGPGAVLELS